MYIFNKLYSIVTNKFYFKILYLIINLCIITILRFIPGIHFFNKVLILWGLFLIAFTIMDKFKNYRNLTIIEICIYVFLIITSLFTLFKYPTIENIKEVVLNFIILTLFFDIEKNKSKAHLIYELNIFLSIYTIFTFILSLVSIVIIFLRKSIWISETLSGEYLVHSFNSAFLNENSLGIASVLSLLISLYLFYSLNKNKTIRRFIFLNIFIQCASLILSNSRSVYLCILTFVIFLLFFYVNNKIIKLILLLFPLLSSLILFTLDKSIINKFLTGRIDLWEICFDAIKENPVYGVGFTNLSSIIDSHNILTLGRVHNIYIEISAVNGIVGILLFLLILISSYILIIKKLPTLVQKEKFFFVILLCITISILSINIVESSLIYIISFISIIFWSILSYLVSIFIKK